ncbi:MAG: hypothetical protein LBD30_02950, partial [Verrucomicrobiales bacterium]|nr:hypothetical protein [Verrucomicrobiales bacterium]
ATTEGEIVTMRIPESAVFDGLQPLDLTWFEMGGRNKPITNHGTYRPVEGADGVTALAWQIDRHAYLGKPADILPISGTPLVEIKHGKGKLIASEMAFEANDPIAQRLKSNILNALMKD